LIAQHERGSVLYNGHSIPRLYLHKQINVTNIERTNNKNQAKAVLDKQTALVQKWQAMESVDLICEENMPYMTKSIQEKLRALGAFQQD